MLMLGRLAMSFAKPHTRFFHIKEPLRDGVSVVTPWPSTSGPGQGISEDRIYLACSIPIFWLNLHKQGTSNFQERKKLLKANGFDLEAINLKGEARRTFLMAVVVFSYVLSIHQGLKTYHRVPTRTFANQQTYKPGRSSATASTRSPSITESGPTACDF
jgi:hypothetical protein